MTIPTFITFSRHRAKAAEKSGPLLSVTLGRFIRDFFEKRSLQRAIVPEEAAYILFHLLRQNGSKHFAYIQNPDSDTLRQMAAFFIRCKRNDAGVGAFFYTEEKKKELERLFESYNRFLDEHGLADMGDIEGFFLEHIEEVDTARLMLDDFTLHGIRLFESRRQEMAYEQLAKSSQTFSSPPTLKNARLYGIEAFDRFDEMRMALKTARELIERNGVAPEDIKIVASSVETYFPLFETLLPELGLVGYSRRGTPLKALLPIAGKGEHPLLRQAKRTQKQLMEQARIIAKRLEKTGIATEKKAIFEKLAAAAYVKDAGRNGIELLETNQIFDLHDLGHLIFVGADMEQFPPKKEEGVFYTNEEERRYLFTNSLYATSRAHYALMKEIAENLYVVHAGRRGKMKLSRSMIVDDLLEPFDPKVLSDIEQIGYGRRICLPEAEAFLSDVQNDTPTRYDGAGVGSFEAEHLSASRINRYLGCPRRYFYSYILQLQPPMKEEEAMEATTQGRIMHLCFELYAKAVKRGEIDPDDNGAAEEAMKEFAKQAYESILEEEQIEPNIYYDIFFDGLVRGLGESVDNPGVLKNFLIYTRKMRKELAEFRYSEMEKRFLLDKNLDITDSEEAAFIKGIIDRIDVNDEVLIHDYKSKRVKGIDTKKIEQIEGLKDLQLGLYLYYAKRLYPEKKIKASLISFKTDNGQPWVEFATLANYDIPKPPRMRNQHFVLYDDTYEAALKARIEEVKEGIAAGAFVWDDSNEEQCGWCEFGKICKRRARVVEK
ncbi:PD-(D/E)XK nuclease family protein [Hydrogenimonas cancrithermarum]|uniref:PD-(D/E)XK endonuclease-like domain-containing protein n=1 Tax=Hydrogenimonas cancrithermarum TaxID=2993563 RepID=A0ABM8FPW3_9BACT|nr:PD-(D/E)XK nuclease family protein [Hydrogenimonas cancrithermarum]BDY13879.1 hypothetical protein HCR_21910 [Hydrogenimonas cancrithermarum]